MNSREIISCVDTDFHGHDIKDELITTSSIKTLQDSIKDYKLLNLDVYSFFNEYNKLECLYSTKVTKLSKRGVSDAPTSIRLEHLFKEFKTAIESFATLHNDFYKDCESKLENPLQKITDLFIETNNLITLEANLIKSIKERDDLFQKANKKSTRKEKDVIKADQLRTLLGQKETIVKKEFIEYVKLIKQLDKISLDNIKRTLVKFMEMRIKMFTQGIQISQVFLNLFNNKKNKPININAYPSSEEDSFDKKSSNNYPERDNPKMLNNPNSLFGTDENTPRTIADRGISQDTSEAINWILQSKAYYEYTNNINEYRFKTTELHMEVPEPIIDQSTYANVLANISIRTPSKHDIVTTFKDKIAYLEGGNALFKEYKLKHFSVGTENKTPIKTIQVLDEKETRKTDFRILPTILINKTNQTIRSILIKYELDFGAFLVENLTLCLNPQTEIQQTRAKASKDTENLFESPKNTNLIFYNPIKNTKDQRQNKVLTGSFLVKFNHDFPYIYNGNQQIDITVSYTIPNDNSPSSIDVFYNSGLKNTKNTECLVNHKYIYIIKDYLIL